MRSVTLHRPVFFSVQIICIERLEPVNGPLGAQVSNLRPGIDFELCCRRGHRSAEHNSFATGLFNLLYGRLRKLVRVDGNG